MRNDKDDITKGINMMFDGNIYLGTSTILLTNFEFEFKNKEPTNEDGMHTTYHTIPHTQDTHTLFIFIYSWTMIAAAAPPRGRLLLPSADHPWDHESLHRILSNLSADCG